MGHSEIVLFASYATKDAEVFKISEIAKSLTVYDEIDKVLYWQEDAGGSIIEYMENNLKKCDIMLLFCSPNSLNSSAVKEEYETAKYMGKPIIPIFNNIDDVPILVKKEIGIKFDFFDFQKNIQGIFKKILKKLKKEDGKEPSKPLEISKGRKKCDYLINLGKRYFDSKNYQEALMNLQKAQKICDGELFDSELIIEIDGLLRQVEDKMNKEAEEKARKEEAEKKARKEEAEKKARKEEAEKKAKKEAEEKAKKIVPFKDAKIPQFEADILQELENQLGKQFSLVNKVEWDTKMGFSVENQRITGIGFYKCGISTLPESIGSLSSLQTLNLWGNELTTLPESISNLKSLKYLNLSGNQFSTLPESIGNLKSLQTLDLPSNQLTTLPESIGNISSLQELNLGGNQLTTLPESIGQLSSLQTLWVDSNQLTTLPESIGSLSSLQTLNLWGNELTTLPESISNLSSLQKLYLSFNQFTTLPESISNLKSLETLYLHNNQLSTLPESISNIRSLTYLNLSSNQFSTLPESIGNLKSLKELNLSENSLDKKAERILKQLEKSGVSVSK